MEHLVGWLALGAGALWVTTYLVPDLLWHHLQWGAWAGARDSRAVGLTFDDGPGPDTPAVLDRLRELGVHATFFVVGERARAHPEVVARMVQEGHTVGIHGDRHRSSYLQWPWQPFVELRRAKATVAALTGTTPRWFRPPWGHHSLYTWWAARWLGLERVLWTVAPDDWRPDRTPEALAHHVVQLALPGGAVVLHDGGGDRRRTVEALRPMVEGLRRLGLAVTAIDAILPDRSELRRWWAWWETRFTRDWDVDSVPDPSGGEPVLRVGLIRYRGPRVEWPDGTVLNPGDPFAEIHFGNPALARFSGQAAAALKAMRRVVQNLPALTAFLDAHPKYQAVVAVGGVTVLDASHAIERVGFRRCAVRGAQRWTMWLYLTLLMAVYHRAGWATLRRLGRLKPVLLVMGREELRRRFAPSGDGDCIIKAHDRADRHRLATVATVATVARKGEAGHGAQRGESHQGESGTGVSTADRPGGADPGDAGTEAADRDRAGPVPGGDGDGRSGHPRPVPR